MNKNELFQVLRQGGFRPDAYNLEGASPDESYCLEESNGIWSVYYSEHGLKTGKKDFASESAACVYLLQLLRKDTSTQS